MQCISTASTIQCVHLCLEFGLRTQSNNSNPGYDNGFGIILELVPKLLSSGYHILIPDLLGYGDTAKPEDPTAYSSKSMAFDLAEILAAEGITHTIVIGHDWGSFLGQRLYFWAPERVAGLVMLNVASGLDRDFDHFPLSASILELLPLSAPLSWTSILTLRMRSSCHGSSTLELLGVLCL
ncbi:hypothetical protein BM1_07808 [Bipolaris maydis]|nr:hypothetical protein BM1_07808 [Bipolaris maydis]